MFNKTIYYLVFAFYGAFSNNSTCRRNSFYLGMAIHSFAICLTSTLPFRLAPEKQLPREAKAHHLVNAVAVANLQIVDNELPGVYVSQRLNVWCRVGRSRPGRRSHGPDDNSVSALPPCTQTSTWADDRPRSLQCKPRRWSHVDYQTVQNRSGLLSRAASWRESGLKSRVSQSSSSTELQVGTSSRSHKRSVKWKYSCWSPGLRRGALTKHSRTFTARCFNDGAILECAPTLIRRNIPPTTGS